MGLFIGVHVCVYMREFLCISVFISFSYCDFVYMCACVCVCVCGED